MNKRSQDDEDLIDCIAKATPGSEKVYIIDVRPRVNAWGNRIAGKGFEDEGKYTSAEFYFIGIHNIHVMRDSLEKLVAASESEKMGSFWSGLENSGWFGHIKSILDASTFIANALCVEGRSVVVHCSDGWDRTSQTCSLAEIMIDPYYRTIHGFMALVEREWLSFGHKFSSRQGFLAAEGKEAKEVSPVFAQFLECVWQFKSQHPAAFQYNNHFLVTLHQHSFSCEYGTFLGNCERERSTLKLAEKTCSLWDYISAKVDMFTDPLYDPNASDVIFPSTDIRKLKFWSGLYNRFSSLSLQRENVDDVIHFMGTHNKALKGHQEYLEKILADMKSNKPPPEEIPLVKMPEKWECPRFKVQCGCGRPFSFSERRLVCQMCGHVTCSECLMRNQQLPWQLHRHSGSICKQCIKKT